MYHDHSAHNARLVLTRGINRHWSASSSGISSEPRMIKSREEADFHLLKCLSHKFFGALLEQTFMWKITVITFRFFPANLIFPKNTIFWETELLYFSSLCSRLCCLAILALVRMVPLFIPPTQANTCNNNTHHSRGIHTCKHLRRAFPVVFLVGFSILEVTSLTRRICNAGCLHLGVCWMGRVETALFMMRQTSSKW